MDQGRVGMCHRPHNRSIIRGSKRCFEIGLLCVQARAEDRPIMSSVLVMLVTKTEMIPQPHPPGFYGDQGLIS